MQKSGHPVNYHVSCPNRYPMTKNSQNKNDSKKGLPKRERKPNGKTVKGDKKQVDQKVEQKDEKKEKIPLKDMFKATHTSLLPDAPEGSAGKRDDLIRLFLKQTIEEHKISKAYNILILHDEGRMIKSDADHIYSAATAFCDKKPLMLVLYSSGGVIDSAYLIGKLCRECATEKFVVVVPRQAKSAATLICCAADEIHMGSLSELGPIDPQVGNFPALGLKSAVEHIAELLKGYPHAVDMFAKYLHLSLDPIHLGYCERVAESAAQYAERLLKAHEKNFKKDRSL